MGMTAFVAVENQNGTYEIYYSSNGAQEYLLQPVLERICNKERLSTQRAFPELYPQDVADELSSRCDPAELEENPLVQSEPIAESVPERELLAHIPGYDTEVVYTVSDDEVDVLVPVVLCADALYQIFSKANVELYHPERGFSDIFQAMESNSSGDIALKGGPITPTDLEELPPWAKTTLEQGHRYMLHKCQRMLHDTDISEMKLILGSGGVNLNLKHSQLDIISHPTLPVRVPWTNSEPRYPMFNGEGGKVGPEPKTSGSTLRYRYYPEVYQMKQKVQGEDEMVVVNGPNVGPMAAVLHDRYGSEFAWEYMSEELSEVVRGELN